MLTWVIDLTHLRARRTFRVLHLIDVVGDGADLLGLLVLRLFQPGGQRVGVLIGFLLGIAREQAGLTPGFGHVAGQFFHILLAGLDRDAGGFMLLGELRHDLVARVGKLGAHFIADLAQLIKEVNRSAQQSRDGPK